MANSSIIGKIKNQIVKELIRDKDIVLAIDSKKVSEPEDLIYMHIFDYNQNPYTIQDVQTFITIQVHIPESYFDRQDENKTFVKPTIEIWITSHENHMKVDNVPKVKQNRNDYLSYLIDKKFNGVENYGIGKLKLVSNIESSYQQDYLFRKMIFETKDFNNSLCNSE